MIETWNWLAIGQALLDCWLHMTSSVQDGNIYLGYFGRSGDVSFVFI